MPFGFFRNLTAKIVHAVKSMPRAGDTRIRHIEGKGYFAEIYQYYNGRNEWVVIALDGEDELHFEAVVSSNWPESYFSETEEGAGKAINRYHQLHYGTHDVIWSSR